MLKIAGREGDIVSIAPLTPGSSALDSFRHDLTTSGDRVADQVEWIRQGAGRRFDDIELSVFAHHVAVTDDAEQATRDLAVETETSYGDVASSPHVLIGPPSAIVESLLERRETHGISYVVFDSADLSAIEPVVAKLAGQ